MNTLAEKVTANIVIIDDDPNNLRLLTNLLARHGYEVRPIANGRLGLSAIAAEPPDLILLDIMMPDLDGYEICHQLKANEKTRDIPVIFLSALSEAFDKVKAFSIGGVDYITKPFQAKEILARIQNHLQIFQLQKQLSTQNEALQKEIYERKLLEDKLQSSQQEILAFFEAITDVVLILDRDGKTLKLAPTRPERLYPPGIDILTQTVEAFFGDLQSDVLHYIHEALDTQSVLNYEYGLQIGDQTAWFSARIVPCSERTVAWVARDISDRKIVEEALRESEERFELAVSGTNDGIWDWDLESDRVYYSPVWMKILGYQEGELPQHLTTWSDRIHPEDLNMALAAINDHFEGKTEIYEHTHRLQHKQGYWIWVQAKGRCLRDRDSHPYRIIGTISDITQKKAVEQALKESAEREKALSTVIQKMRQSLDIRTIFAATTSELRELLECDRVLVYQFNQDWSGQFVAESVDKKWMTILHHSPLCDRIVTGKNCPVRELVTSDLFFEDTYLKETQGAFYRQDLHYIAVSDVEARNFDDCYLELLDRLQAKAYITVPIFSHNQLWGLLAIYQNAAPREWTESEIFIVMQIGNQLGIALQQAELLERTQQQSEALQKAVFAADKANQIKSEFLASMSHELRTPLNAILGFAQVMSSDPSLSEENQKSLSIINRSGEHLLDLINDILELSKIEAGRLSLNEENFDLLQLTDNLEKMLQLKAASKGLKLIFEYGDDLPKYIKSDEGKLRQVLLNLLGNAIKFTEVGHVSLRLRADRSTDNTDRSSPSCRLYFEIEDTGLGIAPEELHLLFEAFTQTETGKKSHQGTGLGLPISQKYVQLMGGNITVKSTPGCGSLFAFDLPVTLGDAKAVTKAKPSAEILRLSPNQPECRILIVDDIAESRLLLVKMLKPLGFSLKEADNGREALAVWHQWQPHLILMDMGMPVMDGYEATRAIREQEANGENPERRSPETGDRTTIFALTASTFTEQRQVILAAGCDDFVGKPFQKQYLLEKIQTYLGIKYDYGSEEASPNRDASDRPAVTAAQMGEWLVQMPSPWLQKLYEASCECNDLKVIELLHDLPPEREKLAIALTGLAENFEFHKILDLFASYLPEIGDRP
ncbi:MAG: response regulator [Cyanobacteria bacterium J007]|nr:MAG: response regulator [Cyanobacteria bacterium J007]